MKPRRNGSPRPGWHRYGLAAWLPTIFMALTMLVMFHRSRMVGMGQWQPTDPSPRGTLEVLSSTLPFGEPEPDREVEVVEGETPRPSVAEPLFLFIGILSGRGYRHRRLAVRDAWSSNATRHGAVVAKFVLSEDERTPQVEKEVDSFQDIIFVGQRTNYKSILYKTYHVLEYAVRHYDVKFVLKTDDDAFIYVAPLVAQLRALCEHPDCEGERIYMGRMAHHSEVLLQQGHKWNNDIFYNHTGLKTYPTYAMGGGYVLSGEVARLLVDTHERMSLKFTPIEDATVGFWVSAMDLRQIDHPRFYTWAAPCCFKAPVRKAGRRVVTRFALDPEFERGLCSDDPWLILHKIDSPTKMRHVGARVANCTRPVDGLAASIKEHYPPAAQEEIERRQRAAQQIAALEGSIEDEAVEDGADVGQADGEGGREAALRHLRERSARRQRESRDDARSERDRARVSGVEAVARMVAARRAAEGAGQVVGGAAGEAEGAGATDEQAAGGIGVNLAAAGGGGGATVDEVAAEDASAADAVAADAGKGKGAGVAVQLVRVGEGDAAVSGQGGDALQGVAAA
ncbi:hypothetical protein ACKKBF_B00425 [Auxenochlorella protothecoides x Auxenochlorella symbiontica]